MVVLEMVDKHGAFGVALDFIVSILPPILSFVLHEWSVTLLLVAPLGGCVNGSDMTVIAELSGSHGISERWGK